MEEEEEGAIAIIAAPSDKWFTAYPKSFTSALRRHCIAGGISPQVFLDLGKYLQTPRTPTTSETPQKQRDPIPLSTSLASSERGTTTTADTGAGRHQEFAHRQRGTAVARYVRLHAHALASLRERGATLLARELLLALQWLMEESQNPLLTEAAAGAEGRWRRQGRAVVSQLYAALSAHQSTDTPVGDRDTVDDILYVLKHISLEECGGSDPFTEGLWSRIIQQTLQSEGKDDTRFMEQQPVAVSNALMSNIFHYLIVLSVWAELWKTVQKEMTVFETEQNQYQSCSSHAEKTESKGSPEKGSEPSRCSLLSGWVHIMREDTAVPSSLFTLPQPKGLETVEGSEEAFLFHFCLQCIPSPLLMWFAVAHLLQLPLLFVSPAEWLQQLHHLQLEKGDGVEKPRGSADAHSFHMFAFSPFISIPTRRERMHSEDQTGPSQGHSGGSPGRTAGGLRGPAPPLTSMTLCPRGVTLKRGRSRGDRIDGRSSGPHEIVSRHSAEESPSQDEEAECQLHWKRYLDAQSDPAREALRCGEAEFEERRGPVEVLEMPASSTPGTSSVPPGTEGKELSFFFTPMDAASLAAVVALNPKQGERVLDMCCSPGMKLQAIAEHLRTQPHEVGGGYVIGVDIDLSRLSVTKSLLLQYNKDMPLPVGLFHADGTSFTLADAWKVAPLAADLHRRGNSASAANREPLRLKVSLQTGLTAKETQRLKQRQKQWSRPVATNFPSAFFASVVSCSSLRCTERDEVGDRSRVGKKQQRRPSVSTAQRVCEEECQTPQEGAAPTSTPPERSELGHGREGHALPLYLPEVVREQLLSVREVVKAESAEQTTDSGFFDAILVDVECTHDGSLAHLETSPSCSLSNRNEESCASTSSPHSHDSRQFCALTNAHRMERLNIASPQNTDSGSLLLKRFPQLRSWWLKEEHHYLDWLRSDPLLQLQFTLLLHSFSLLRVGGRLVYSTCSMSFQQNEYIIYCLLELLQDEKKREAKNVLHQGCEAASLDQSTLGERGYAPSVSEKPSDILFPGVTAQVLFPFKKPPSRGDTASSSPSERVVGRASCTSGCCPLSLNARPLQIEMLTFLSSWTHSPSCLFVSASVPSPYSKGDEPSQEDIRMDVRTFLQAIQRSQNLYGIVAWGSAELQKRSTLNLSDGLLGKQQLGVRLWPLVCKTSFQYIVKIVKVPWLPSCNP